MEILKSFIDVFMHLDHHMVEMTATYGNWVYVIIFIVIFVETGLVIMPFLPGDSFIFVLGALAAKNALHLDWLLIILCSAAIIGDMVNYSIGRLLAPKIFNNEKIPFLKREHLTRTEEFYKEHGPKTIIIARFLPVIRTFAPFLAGVANMPYAKFFLFNVTGGLLWVFISLFAGFFFGNLPFVSKNFSVVIMAIVVLSIIPAVFEIIRQRNKRRAKAS